MSARRSSLFTTSALGALALAAVWGTPAHAQLVQGPTPAQSNGGAPTINQAGGNTTVTLGGSRTVIDWDRFDINSGERADFIFANGSDIVLNRVGGAAGSTINGDLNGMIGAGGPAGGNIWIYNANGVVIGANARINTGGLLVTTAALDRATDSSAGGFLDGSATSFNFSGAYDGARIDVRTGAQIDTRGGALALVSPIINTETGSTLTASNGGNVLYGSAAGYKVSFRPTSTNDLDLLSFEVTSGAGGYGGTANLAGTTSGNRVFVSVVSQTGLVSQLVAPGAITATNVGTDETGAIVLTTNRNIVSGAVAASAVAGSGTGNLSAGDLTASAIDLVSSGYVLLNGSQNAAGGSIRLIAETGNIHQNGPKITANTLSASAAGNIELGAGASGTPNSVAKLTSLTSTSGYISFAGDSYEIAGPITTPGAVGLSSTGLITGAGLITAGSLSFDAAGTINVNGNANLDYSNSRGNLTVNATGNIAMPNGWRLNGHALNLVSSTGSITQSGDAIYYGGTLNATAAGNIDFGGQTNQIDSFYGTSVAGDIIVKSAGSLSFAVDTLGNATVDAGGAAIAGGAMHAGTLGVRASNYIDLTQSVLQIGSYRYLTSTGSGVSINTDSTINIGGNISVASSADVSLRSNAGAINQTAGTITGRQLSLQAAGSIVQNSAAQLVGTGTGANSVRAGDDLILAGSNRIAGFDTPILGWGAGSDVTYRSAYNMFFDGSSVAIGALNLIVDSGSIQQGSIAFTANSFSASATGDIDIGTSANNSIARLGNIGSSAGEVRLRVGTNNPLAIDGTISSASRVIFSARGAVSGVGKFATPGLYLGLIEGGTINVAGSTNLLELGVSNADATVRADDSLTLSGTLAANGRKLTLIAGTGSITQTGGSFIGTGTLSATAAADISLTAANSFSGADAASTGGGRITLNATGSLLVGLNTTGSAAVTAGGNLSSNGITVDSLSVDAGDIDLTAGVDVNSFTRLVAAYGDILVTNNGGFAVAGDVTTNRPGLRTIDLRANGGGISQTAGTISGHYVRLRGAGDLIQSGTGRVDSNAADFNGANVLLGGANNLISNDTRIAATGHLTLRNAGSIDLTVIGGYTAGGVLTLTSDTGSITSTDAISATAVTAHAANGAVTFNHANNLFAEIRGLSAATNATIVSRYGGFALHGDADVGGTLSLRAGQWINQTAGRIKATTLDAQLYQTMTTGSVLLGGANDVDNLYVLAASGSGDVLFRDTDGFRVTYAVIGNRVTLTSDAGAITQASGIMDGVQANQLTVSAVDGISLNNEWNGIRTILGLTNSGTGGIDVSGRGVNMVLAGNVTAAGQAVSFNARNASLTQTGGAIVADSLSAQAQTGIALTSTTNNVVRLTGLGNVASGGIAYTDADSFTIAGTIVAGGQAVSLKTIDTSSFVTQTSTSSLLTAGTLNLSGGQGYSLNGNGATWNYITALGNIDTAVSIYTDSNIDLTGTISSPYFELWARGNVTQSGGRIDRALTGDVFEIRADRIALTSATNRLGKVDALLTWGNVPGTITAVSTGDTKFGDVVARDASLTVSGGSILAYGSDGLDVDTLAVSSAGTISLGGRIGALSAVLANGDAAFRSSSGLAFTDIVDIDTGRLMLRSSGAISQTGGYITAGAIDVSAATGIDLGRTNVIGAITGLSTTNGDISFRNWNSIGLPHINAPGTVTLISENGSVSQNIGTTLTANRVNASAATFIDLTKANQLASLGTLSAGTTIHVTNHGSFALTGDISATAVTLNSSFGAINQTGGAISTSNLTVNAQNGIDLGGANTVGALDGLSTTFGDIAFRNQGNIVLSDVFALTGAVTLTSDSGSITQGASTMIMAERLNASAATGITLDQDNSFVRTGTLSNNGTGGIRIRTNTNLDIAGTVTATGQAVRFEVGNALTQSVALGAYSSLTVNAGTGIYLDQANNFGATAFSFSNGAGDITVRNVGNLTLPAITTSGTIRLISDTGTIGQTGIFTANTLIASARREIALGRNNVITNVGGLANTSGTITFRDVDGFNITGDIRGSIITGERLDLSAGGTGDIVQTGGSIVADKLRVTVGGNLTLDGSANTFMNVEVLSVGGDVRLRAQDGFVVGYTLEAGGTMTLTSTNGSIGTELGSIGHVRADALYVNAATGIDINLPGNITPKVSLISAAGNIRYTSQGAMELLALRTPDRAIISANALTQSGAIDIGSLDALARDIRLDMAGNRIGSIHAAMATGGDVVITDEDGIDIAGNLNASGAISLTAGGTGSITQSGGVITAPTVSLVAAGGNITLDRANAAGVYNARSAIGGTITLRNDGDLKVNAITAQDGTVNLTSNTGSIGQLLIPGNSIWTGKLNVSAATDIDLAAQNLTGLLGNLTAGGSIRYNSFGTLGLDGDIRAVGGVTFDIQGYLGQYSGTITASHLDVTATGIALIGANDIGSTTASRFSASDDIIFRSVNSILLGAVTTPGLLSLTSDTGGISQTAAFSAGRFDAIAAGDIVLEQLNTLDTIEGVTAGDVFSLRTAGALVLDGRIAAADRVSFNTGGGLSQIGNTVIVTDRLEATAGTATLGGIRLLNHNRVGVVSLDASGNDIRFRNTGNIAINAINSPTGTVELISNLGQITQQAGGGLIVGSLVVNAGNGVALYNTDNQIARLDVISRGNVSIHTGASGFGGMLTIDRIDAAGQVVSLNNASAGTTGGNIIAATLNVFSAGNLDLGTTNNVTGEVSLSGWNTAFTNRGNLVIAKLMTSSGDAVLRSEEGAISQIGSAMISTNGLTAYGRDGVTLAGAIKRIDGLSADPGADVEIVTDLALELAGNITARNVLLRSNMAPNVFNPTGGAITQTGGIITADLFRGSAYGAIDLRLGNQIAALGDVWSFTSGISITSDRALDLTGALTATAGDVVLDAASIGQSGGSIEALGLRVRADGAIDLGAANLISATGTVAFNAGGDIAFRNDGGFTLGLVDTPGAAIFNSTNGSIGQAASTRIGASRLTVSAGNGGINLNEANLVDTLGGVIAGGAVVFRTAGDLALDGDIAATGQEVTLRSNTGSISQTSGTITALGLTVQANGAIALGGANSVTNLRDMTAGGNLLYRNAGALMLWGDVTGDTVTLSTDSGSLLQMLFTGGIITANRLNAKAGGALNFNHANRVVELGDYASGPGIAGFTNDGGFALVGDVSGDELVLQSLTGGITQSAGSIDIGSINASAAGSILLNRGNQVAAGGTVRLVSTGGDVTFRALGDFTLDFGTATGTFDVTSDNGSISQSGLITANRLNARAGRNIALTGDNAVAGLGTLTAAGDIAFTAAGDLLLTDAIDADGNVLLVANAGLITQNGGTITAASLDVSADGSVELVQANTVSAFAGASTGGNITLRNTGSISLGAVTLGGAFGLTLDAGAVTQSGDLRTAGGLSIAAHDGIMLTRSGNANQGPLSLANLGTGGIAYTDNGAIAIASIAAAGQAVTLNAGGAITQTGGIEAALLNLTTSGNVMLTDAAGNRIDALGTVDVDHMTLATAGGLDLAGSIAASTSLTLTAGGRLTQSGGLVTSPSLTIAAVDGIDLGSVNQVDALVATNSNTGDIRFINGRSMLVSDLRSEQGDLSLRLIAGQLTLGGTIFSLGNMDIDAAGSIAGAASIESQKSVRVTSGGSIDLASVVGRDDILIDATGDAKVAELLHLAGGADAAGNGYTIDILGNNATLGAISRASLTGTDRLYVETGATVRLGARAGNATLNLATMNHGVSIAATGDVSAYGADGLNLVNVSGANVSLSAGTGGIGADRVYVAGNYSLEGPAFFRDVLQPLGVRAGRWTLTSTGDVDAAGRTLEYGGDIDFTADGTVWNGSVRSLNGAVSISAGVLDLNQVSATTGIRVDTVGALNLFSADTFAGGLGLTGSSVFVGGSLDAAGDITVDAVNGDAVIGYAIGARNISVSAAGNATLRQANLNGATGDLIISAGGNATLGEDDAMSGIGTDRWFARAAGSTGSATVTGGAGISINLDRSAKLDSISGRRVEVNIATGDLTIGQLTALTERGIVNVLGGSLVIGSAAATGSALDLSADGDLTLLSSTNGFETYLTAGGLLDTRTAIVNGASYVELTGGEIRAGAITSGGDIDALSTSGTITADSVHSTGGDAIFNALTDLNLNSVIANGGQLQAGGNATLRAISAANGFALVALGSITLGADTAGQVTGGNLLSTGGGLSGCACGSGGATLISLNGSVNVNLQSATGVFDTIAAGINGDANVHVATGDLGIGDLAGHNIAVMLPGGTLTAMNPVSSGGNYTLTARDFAGNALLPIVGGSAAKLNNVTITDTDGDLAAAGTLVAAGDIRVSAVGNITGALALYSDRDVDVSARAIRLGDITGRDVVLNASAGGVDIVGAVTIGRSYILTGTGFFGNALAMTGTRAGDLLVTDTAGDFDYTALDLGFAGSATLRATGGAIRGGDIDTLGNLTLSASGVSASMLRSAQGGVDVESSAGVDLNGVQASNAIRVKAGGDLRLGSAELSGTGVNAFTLAARGDLAFGASSAGAIGSGNIFTSAGSAMTGGGVQADGAIAINLDRSAELARIDGGTLELTVRNGDLTIGNVRTVGALFVTGPAGALTIGDVETSAGHIGISGQGNVSTGAVNGRFVIDIGSSAGSLTFGRITGGEVTLGAAGGVTATGVDAGIFASSLALAVGGDVDLATHGTGSRIGRLGAVTVANGGLILNNLQDLDLNGAIDVSGTLDLRVAGALNQSGGSVTAQRLVGSVSGLARLDGPNRVTSLGDFSTAGLLLNNATALGIEGVVDGGAGSVTIRARGGMTIGAAGTVRSVAVGDAITLAADGLFRNLAGGSALSATNGRWLVYTQATGNAGASDPANDFGGLAGRSFYGAAYDFATGSFGAAPNAGNRFVYGYRPVLTVLPNNVIVTYDGQVPVLGASMTGLVNGDRAADAWSGAASLSGAGRNAGTYNIVASRGTLASDMNYDFAFGTGTLRIDPRTITATLAANGKTYDGTAAATGTLSLGGVIVGDDVGVSGSLAFGDKNAGTGKTVTASSITLNGTDAGNYTVNLTATGLADILARTITATLTANGKTYDGNATATGALSLNGVVAGDDVGATGMLAFGDKNAGAGKMVTASGIALSGADAGNYVVNASATAFADILARAITATLTANGKVYDGTTTATGSLSLGGVLAGDTVSASGSYAFGDKNAGTGKTVTASGISLSGADAGNYVVNTSATGPADILARTITATLAANGKVYDGTTAATGTLSLDGMIAGDDVGVAGSLTFGDKNAGTGKAVTANGIALSGADAGNYTVNTTATAFADILARAITATLRANGKTYDGTTAATGSLSLGGVLAGDQVAASGSYAFTDKNAGNGKTVTASGIALSGTDAGNYTVNVTATALADILARAITATLAANGKVYDGTTAASGTLSLGGVLAGDTVNASGSFAYTDKNAGTGKKVTASGIALSGADAGNYTVNATATGLADIFARAITATLAANGKVYDGTTAASGTLSLGGVIAGDDVGASGSLTFGDKNAGSGKTVTANGIALSGADAGNYTVNATATGLADILARTITATLAANGKVYDGITAATGSLSLSGLIAGDQVGASGTYAFGDKNAGTGRTVTASGITLSGADAANYIVNGSATDVAAIARLAITGTATADSRVYDGTTAATGRIMLNGVLAGDTVSASAAYAFADRNAGTARTVSVNGVTLNGVDAGNYTVTLGGGPVLADILRRAVTVQADDLTKLFGQRDPGFTWRVVGGSLVAGDGFTGELARAPGEQAGTYVIDRGSLTLSPNYSLSVVPGSLVIRFTQSGADSSDALHRRRPTGAFSLYEDPSVNLSGDARGE